MSEYQPIPVEAARHLAKNFSKSIVVVVALDPEHQLTHFTSWGDSPQDKLVAAQLADEICIATGHSSAQMTPFEDFRNADAAKRAADIEALVAACRHAVAAPFFQISRTLKERLQAALDFVKAY